MTAGQIAQIASAVFAGGGLCFVAWQLWRARQTATLDALQKFLSAANDRERALRDDEDKRHALVEFMNFLEVYSAASSECLISGVAREFVDDKIVDSVVELKQAPGWHQILKGSINSEVVYKHLLHFINKHRDLIAQREAASTALSQG